MSTSIALARIGLFYRNGVDMHLAIWFQLLGVLVFRKRGCGKDGRLDDVDVINHVCTEHVSRPAVHCNPMHSVIPSIVEERMLH